MRMIRPLDKKLALALQHKIDHKTKPLGALGQLETLALKIGLIQQTLAPCLLKPAAFVFAGDHGITEAGVSPYPQAVTAQMVLNFVKGGAAINVFAKHMGFNLQIVDAGVNYDFDDTTPILHHKIAHGTKNFLHQPAMTFQECEQALACGATLVEKAIANGSNVFAFGEMGIGNTSAAAAIMSVLCDMPIQLCTGRGTGLDDAGVAHKTNVLAQAIATHNGALDTPQAVLQYFGGFEIAMMVGAMLSAASGKALVLVDGFISSAAALVAAKMQPNFLEYCVFSHCSHESGHALMLQHLGVKPMLNLDLRLGEGTGAVLVYPLVQAAVNFLNEMASFEDAGVQQAEKNVPIV